MRGYRNLLAVGVLAALVAVVAPSNTPPGVAAMARTAAQSAPCGGLGTAADFDVFSDGDYLVQNTQLQGRAAARGDVSVSSYGVGVQLAPDARRFDLIAGGALTASNAQAHRGSVSYGTTFSGSISTPNGTVEQISPVVFEDGATFDSAFAALRARSGELDALSANGTITGPTYGAMQLTGADPDRNVFAIAASQLETAQQIQIKVPFGATTIVNVSGSTYSSAVYPTSSISYWDGSRYVQFSDQAPTPDLGALRDATLWNFPLANRVEIGPNLAWQGSILAPSSAVDAMGGTQINGQVIGASVEGNATVNHHPFSGCLPPAPTDDLALDPLCRNSVSNTAKLRLRNTGASDVRVAWSDLDSAQSGAFTARAQTDTVFAIADGDTPHRITVTSATESETATSETRACRGTIAVQKIVRGPGTPAAGPWTIRLAGDNGYRREFALAASQSRTFTVPGDHPIGQVPIGESTGGYHYTVVEPDPLGAIATVSHVPVTIIDGEAERVIVRNFYPTVTVPPTTPPTSPPGTTPPTTPDVGAPGGGDGGAIQPPTPVLPPGVEGPGDDLGFLVDQDGTASPDLAVTESLTPDEIPVGGIAQSRVIIRNQGVSSAANVVVRELPQQDPAGPNEDIRILSVDGVPAGQSCTSARPIRCPLGTMTPGAAVTVVAKGEVLVPGSLRSIVFAATTTPESNLTNNAASDGIVALHPAEPLRVRVVAPAVVAAGTALSYRVSVTATRKSVAQVHLCHRPSSRLLVTSTGGAHRARDLICLDIATLRGGQTRSFTVRAIASARAVGQTAKLRATADSPGRPTPASGFDTTRIVGAAHGGLG